MNWNCCRKQEPTWYKYVVLIAAAVCQMLTMGFLVGTVQLLPIFYQERYNERRISGVISTLMISFMAFGGENGETRKLLPTVKY